MISLNAAMFVEFTRDDVVFPPISEQFGEVSKATAGVLDQDRKQLTMT